MTQALEILHREHRAIAAVLHCFEHVLSETREKRLAPEFEFFRAVITYMRDFPDRFHHPKEEEFLFKAMREKAPDLHETLDNLHQQHIDGDRMLSDLEHKLEDWEAAQTDENAAIFGDAADAYIDSQRRHAALEERTVMPQSRKMLDETDWEAINAAFADNDDPLFGSRTRDSFGKLFSRVVSLAPAPWGLAERVAPPPKTADGDIDPDMSRWTDAQRRAILNMNWI